MPAFETMDLKEKAVLWMAADDGTPNDFDAHGEHKVIAPVEISVRWNQGRTESVDPQGARIALDATVVVDQNIKIGSIMWLGKHIDLPGSPTELHEVVTFRRVKDIKGRNIRRVAGLRKYSDELPTIKS